MIDASGNPSNWFTLLILFLIIWSGVWKAIALWKAVKNNSLVWYVILFIFNTAGILEIIYIYAVANKGENSPR